MESLLAQSPDQPPKRSPPTSPTVANLTHVPLAKDAEQVEVESERQSIPSGMPFTMEMMPPMPLPAIFTVRENICSSVKVAVTD
jgi:hypothetical protein